MNNENILEAIHFREVTVGLIFLVVMVTVGIIISFVVRELFRMVVKKITGRTDLGIEEGSFLFYVENLIPVIIVAIIGIVVMPYVVGFMEGLAK